MMPIIPSPAATVRETSIAIRNSRRAFNRREVYHRARCAFDLRQALRAATQKFGSKTAPQVAKGISLLRAARLRHRRRNASVITGDRRFNRRLGTLKLEYPARVEKGSIRGRKGVVFPDSYRSK